MRYKHFRNNVLLKDGYVNFQGVHAFQFAPKPGIIGTRFDYPIRFSDSNGWVQPRYDDAMMPAWWRTVWTTSNDYPGCSNIQQDWDLPVITWYHLIFICQNFEYGTFFSENYSVDPDGDTIWTGGADKLLSGGILYPGDSRTSGDGRFELIYQYDANLVLYGPAGAMWALNCWPGCSDIGAAGHVHNQDGNLVVYDANDNVVWASNTGGWYGAALIVQTDGNLVMYEPYGMALWSTGTGGW